LAELRPRGGRGGGCDGRVTGTIQFTIPSDPVGSKVVPEVEDFETDSERQSGAADTAVSDWLKEMRLWRF